MSDSFFILGTESEPEPPKRGRPKAVEPGVSVKTWLRESEYDRLIRVANRRGETVSGLVRSLLILRLPR